MDDWQTEHEGVQYTILAKVEDGEQRVCIVTDDGIEGSQLIHENSSGIIAKYGPVDVERKFDVRDEMYSSKDSFPDISGDVEVNHSYFN